MIPPLFASAGADVILPPTFVLDFLYLGFPVGIAAGAAIVVGAVATYRRSRARGRTKLRSVLLAALMIAAANFAIYAFWLRFLYESPSRRHFREIEAHPPAAASAGTAADAGP